LPAVTVGRLMSTIYKGGKMKVKLDMSLRNDDLYRNCDIEEVGGRKNLLTPPDVAGNIIGRNVHEILESIPRRDREICILTGPMAIWAYLIVFHAVVHSFVRVYYFDGRNDPVLLSAHGALRHPEEATNLLDFFNNYLYILITITITTYGRISSISICNGVFYTVWDRYF
jgi:hypothetical protein